MQNTTVSAAMQQKYARVINFLYGPFIRVIGFFYRSYSANRARLQRFMANRGVARFLQALTILVFVGWMLVWMFASDEQRTRLTDEVRKTIGGYASGASETAPPE